ncbi:unnamed protein product [Haemonchus placei]|uniref:Glycine-rich cell wall structural protein 1 n=1 Tax=Haemonchus placei TaxID=6290 RepID=A0A0N4X3T1_HAEPC|nr:unnamed protein product [Haemonchus placei]
MRWIAILFTGIVLAKAQDFASLLGPLLGGAGGGGGGPGGGIGSILAGLGGGGGGKGPDLSSLFQLGAGLLNRNGGGANPAPVPAPVPAPGPAPAPVIGGPTNIAVPDYSDYNDENIVGPSRAKVRRQQKEQRRKAKLEKEVVHVADFCQMLILYACGFDIDTYRPQRVTDTPAALSPPNSLTWIKGAPTMKRNDFGDDYDMIGMTRPAPRSVPPPPPPQQFIPVGRG